MTFTPSAPRVTLGIATYNRDTYLAAAIESCLAQDYADLEVLVVVDGATNPGIDAVLGLFAAEPRLRVVRHERNQGIAAAYNTIVSAGRGELIAMLGDDDLALPSRIRRQVEVFDRHPETGVVHGDAEVIDAAGRHLGTWTSPEMSPAEMRRSFFRRHNHIVDPTRMVHRRVYEAVGGYDAAYPLANDFDLWLRAAVDFRFRHVGGEPLSAVRRHGENTSAAHALAQEVSDVERALDAALPRYSLRELVPELDWSLYEAAEGEARALARLADALEVRALPLPGLAARLRERARAQQAALPSRARARRAAHAPQRLMMTAYGWNDSGGGTTVPRLAAKELVRRGWDVTVFHAAVAPTPSRRPYELVESEDDGVRLIGVHNRPHGLFDLHRPSRELDDPAISRAFAEALDRHRPDAVHFHNLHNLGASLFDHTASRGLPAYFTTHNYWLICPRAYLLTGEGEICAGPGDGTDCASCTGGGDILAYQDRLAGIRSRASRGLGAVLAVSEAVRRALIGAGYPADLIDVVRQAMPHEGEIWSAVGHERRPGRTGERLTVAFLGSAYAHKGPQLLVEAAQRCAADVRVRIIGEVSERFATALRRLDRRGVVELDGAFAPSEIAQRLRDVDVAVLPSMWWDCAPLAAAECLAARVPLLVPRLGGLPEAVRDGVDGLVFDGLDAGGLAAAIDRVATEPGLLERLQSGITAPRAFSDYVDDLEAYYTGERPGRGDGSALASAPAAADLAVRWQGDHGRPTSLSIINDQITARLPGAVQRVARDGTGIDAPLPHPADIEVRHQWPPDLSRARSGRLALIQPWEFGAIPRDWLPALGREVDELWVPSEYVRGMYLAAGVAPDRVAVVPNGVNPETFSPEGEKFPLEDADGVRLLFVGGFIGRKGADLLLDTYLDTFAGRPDVTLVIKDFGADGVYRTGDRSRLHEHIASGALPRVVLVDRELATEELASLMRACDVLVHPYRGEGFAMPVLEAMACGRPVVVTAGGPTDEFCPPDAGWRVASARVYLPSENVDAFATAGRPWLLEPDAADLARCLQEAVACGEAARDARGRVGRAAATRLSWDAVARLYAERLAAVAARPLRAVETGADHYPLSGDYGTRLLATPAWRGEDRLGDLLASWVALTDRTTDACLYLLADPSVDGSPEELEAHVLAAAGSAGVDIDACADIDVVMEIDTERRDERLHAAADLYVSLHPACAGHERLARAAGNPVLAASTDALAPLIAAAHRTAPSLA